MFGYNLPHVQPVYELILILKTGHYYRGVLRPEDHCSLAGRAQGLARVMQPPHTKSMLCTANSETIVYSLGRALCGWRCTSIAAVGRSQYSSFTRLEKQLVIRARCRRSLEPLSEMMEMLNNHVLRTIGNPPC